MSRCTEPEHAELIRMFNSSGTCGPFVWADEYRLRTFTIILYIYLRNGPAHIVQRPTGKSPGAPDGQSHNEIIYIKIPENESFLVIYDLTVL